MILLQGDCLELMKDIPDGSVDLILCDLPYGTTACRWDSVIPFPPLWEQYNRIIKPNGPIVLFGSEPFSTLLRYSNLKRYKYDWVWNKKLAGNGILAKKQPLKIHENIMVFNTTIYNPQKTKGKMQKKQALKGSEINGFPPFSEGYVNDEYYPKSIQEFFLPRKGRLHPTQKPVALLEYLIRTYTVPGETVLDNCMGSGSTGVACVNTGRDFIGMELERKYFDIASERIAAAQRQEAT